MVCERTFFLSRTAVVVLASWLAFGNLVSAQSPTAKPAPPAKPAGDQVAAVEAMLETIDPYRPEAEANATIQVFGSTAMDALAHGWVNGFTQFHKGAKVEISAANSSEAFDRLAKQPTGIAMLSRPVKSEELESLKMQGLKQPVAFEVAREALGVFVHSSNPANTISGEQLRKVFTAESDHEKLTWSVLGATGAWASQPMKVISRTPTSGTQMFLQDFVFNGLKLRDGVSEHVSNADVVSAVAKDPQAIGICGLRCGATTAKPLQLTVGASVVPSDDHAILSGQYPLTRPLSLVIDLGQKSPAAMASQEYVRYALCRAGQQQSILAGYYPVDLPLLRAGLQRLGNQQFR
ncbi:MAG: substrate-binding domain-containing protein [Pirellulaceae bacterium]